MAAKPDIVAGTITLTTGLTTFTGTDTFWQFADIREGDTIIDVTGATEFMGVIETITDNTTGTLTKPWEGPTLTAEYRIRYMADGQRQTAQARNLIELLGNGRLTAIASAPETAGVIEMMQGGSARLVPLTDLVSGANYDVQVANMAARAAFDGQTAGFAVLVADTGDGRAAIFSKLSNASGDWSAAAYVTGPVGPPAEVTVGTTTTGAPGTPALVTPTPTPDGVELDFTIPAGEGFAFQGAYDVGTAYNKGDVVRYNNSSWIALQATTGNAPPVLPTTANANWELLAAAGANGTGTGDVVGPASSTDGGFARFDGITGELLKDSAAKIANADLANVPTATFKGRTTAAVGSPEDLTLAQALTLLKTAGAYAKDNILGAVSQTAGVPTGAIIERGSNANGEYIRWADGTQICRFKSPGSLATTVAVSAPIYASVLGTFTFPVAFIAVPGVAPAALLATGSASWITLGAITTTTVGIYLISAFSGSTAVPEYIAVGRWF